MAIYHLEAKVISRGTGRSAVAASAYLSCSEIFNDYDGIQHDHTRKKGLVWQQVFLPRYAPQEWQDRSVLWNAVEENEKKLLQAKHRLEEAQMRDRQKERKARTRRLIQEGAILEKALPQTTQMTLEQLEVFLCEVFKPIR